jgi:hypothetical protein
MLVLAICLFAAASPLPGSAASHSPLAGVSKMCKKRGHHHKKRRCKRRRTVATAASLAISPPSQDFGQPSVVDMPVRTFAVTNVGGMASGVPMTTITGSGAGSFVVVDNGCTAPLPPGGACAIAVELPLRDPVGPKSARLEVTAIPGGTASAAMTGDVEI